MAMAGGIELLGGDGDMVRDAVVVSSESEAGAGGAD
jgi:hypothetical protein